MASRVSDLGPPDPLGGPPDPDALEVHLAPMRRRHLRAVMRIEAQVYPRPWSLPLFLSELNLRTSRIYYVARVNGSVVGYHISPTATAPTIWPHFEQRPSG